MIKHNNKKCSLPVCNAPLYAKGYCIYHYKSIYLFNKIGNKPKLTATKRRINKSYTGKRAEFINNERNNRKDRKIFCIFCGKEIIGEPSLHHGLGRDDSIMLDTNYWFLSHNNCHVHQYHSMSCNDISWWPNYIERIKHIKPIYNKELRRMNK